MEYDRLISSSKSLRMIAGNDVRGLESLRALASNYGAHLIFGGFGREPNSIYVCFDDRKDVEIPNAGFFARLRPKRYHPNIESKMAGFLSEYAESDIRSQFPLG